MAAALRAGLGIVSLAIRQCYTCRVASVPLLLVPVVSIDGVRVRVRNLEALDGTPIVDVKPILGPVDER
jgi:tRNA (Thr-GGU) A37 N-methylase